MSRSGISQLFDVLRRREGAACLGRRYCLAATPLRAVARPRQGGCHVYL